MYLIPKNIKIKREIFKGFGGLELGAMAISFGIGYVMSLLAPQTEIKVFLFFLLPLATFLMLLPLPNGSTALKIFMKFIRYIRNQRIYKIK